MKKFTVILLVCTYLMVPPDLFAQTTSSSTVRVTLPEGVREDLKSRAINMLSNFTVYVSRIANKDLDINLRNNFIERATTLFRDSAIMQVSSLNNPTVNYLLPEYLKRLRDLPYDQVQVEFVAEGLYFDDTFEKVPTTDGSEEYVTTAVIVQRFCGSYNSNDNREFQECDYTDETMKTVKITAKQFTDVKIGGKRWIVLLGDVTVTETKKI